MFKFAKELLNTGWILTNGKKKDFVAEN